MPVATTLEQAAYQYLSVFTQPEVAWPASLQAGGVQALYVEPPREGLGPGPMLRLMRNLRGQTAGGAKYLLTGQRGSGKSFALAHLAHQLRNEFHVVRVSATDHTGTTQAEVELADLLLILAQHLAGTMQRSYYAQDGAAADLKSWMSRFATLASLPPPPSRTESPALEISSFFAKLSSRMRTDGEMSKLVRAAAPDDLLTVVNEFLRALAGDGQRVLVLFDDLDKIDLQFAGRLFGAQLSVLARLDALLVLTMPFATALGAGAAWDLTTLRNQKVWTDTKPLKFNEAAVSHFRDLVGKLVEPALLEEPALRLAVSKCGGIPREFGKVMVKAFEVAEYQAASVVNESHVREAHRQRTVELSGLIQLGERRESLERVAGEKRLTTAVDHAMLELNLLIEYVNGHRWYGVHPLVEPLINPAPVEK